MNYLLINFTCDVSMISLSRSWHWSAAIASAASVARLGAVTDWWCSSLMANMLACLSSCHWWTFWTYLVTVNLFSLYLMNFMFHTTVDAVGNILKLHYKSMKCENIDSVSIVRYLGGVNIYVCKKMFSYLQQCKNYKHQASFSRVMITYVLPHYRSVR